MIGSSFVLGSLRSQVRFIQVLKCAAFQFLELLQVAFLELLQDITKVYAVGWKERLTKPSCVGAPHGDTEIWVLVIRMTT